MRSSMFGLSAEDGREYPGLDVEKVQACRWHKSSRVLITYSSS